MGIGIGILAAAAGAAYFSTRPLTLRTLRTVMDLPGWNADLNAYYSLPDGDILVVRGCRIHSASQACTAIHDEMPALTARLFKYGNAAVAVD